MVLVLGKNKEGAILIDTQTAPFGAQIRREAEHLGKKVELLVNTHHHADVTGGNHAFTVDTRVVAHAKCKERIDGQMNRYVSQIKEFLMAPSAERARETPSIQADWKSLYGRVSSLKAREFTPTETLKEPRTELTVAGRKVVLMAPVAPRGAHTDNDVVVHLPDDDVLIVGGLVSAHVHAVIDADGGSNTHGWQEALEQLEHLAGPRTLVIPGEGKPGDKSLLRWQHTYLKEIRGAVERAVAGGRTRAQVRQLKPPLHVPAGDSDTRLLLSLDAVFEEVKAAAPQAPAKPPK
jgi:glyoxylase-like metal-dependent hydrolase (beta-lactamase superfamily II)